MSVNLQPFPSSNAPVSEGGATPLAQIWYYLLRTIWQRLGGSGSTLPAQTVTVTASPFQYSSDISGTLVVQGGTVSEIDIVRGGSSVTTGQTAGAIPMLRGDLVNIVYSGKPNVTFLPSEFVQSST